MRDKIIRLIRLIAERDLGKEVSSLQHATYNDQRTLIKGIFNGGPDYSRGSVMLRLVVIDSLYSTNAGYSYFAFDEMAENIFALGEEEESASDYFYRVALTGMDDCRLFSEPYGIKKNLGEGSKQMSLLSKYAYYCLMKNGDKYPLGFPIYDSLAKSVYPGVCQMMGIRPHALPSMNTPDIKTYVLALSELKTALFGDTREQFFGFQQYDLLDAYLWRLGKLESGNLSLLLGREDYVKFVSRMMKSTGTAPSTENSKLFDNRVMQYLLSAKAPFSGLSNEEYLLELLEHWRVFHSAYKRKGFKGFPLMR